MKPRSVYFTPTSLAPHQKWIIGCSVAVGVVLAGVGWFLVTGKTIPPLIAEAFKQTTEAKSSVENAFQPVIKQITTPSAQASDETFESSVAHRVQEQIQLTK